MKYSMFLNLVTLLLSLQSFSSTATVQKLCPWLEGYYITYADCVATLESDPNSRTADDHGLAVISVNLTIANATGIASKLDALFESESEPSLKRLLGSCSKNYSDAMPSLARARDAAGAKNYSAAADGVFKFMAVPEGCDQEFYNERGVMSPVMKENSDLNSVIVLAHAVNDYLASAD